MVRLIRQVRVLNNTYRKVNKQKEWGSDPLFAELNPTVRQWMDDLPGDLQLTFPDNGTTPQISSHFLGNMHSYHHLLVIMLHRPQLMHSSSFSAGGSWKQHMSICYSSAKAMCKLQESILQTFGVSGFLCMQRGINFVIYAVLTCTMIHLVSQAILLGFAVDLFLFRLLSRHLTRNLTPMQRTISRAICESSNAAHQLGQCKI